MGHSKHFTNSRCDGGGGGDDDNRSLAGHNASQCLTMSASNCIPTEKSSHGRVRPGSYVALQRCSKPTGD